MSTLLVVCGAPGAGKTTAVEAATAGLQRLALPKDNYPAREALIGPAGTLLGVELGVRRPPFSGTDTLPMNAVTAAERYLQHLPECPPVVVAEGARLANQRFLSAGVAAGMEVHLLHLATPQAEQWREQRAKAVGKAQNPGWVKGRTTAALNLAADAPAGVQVATVTDPDAAVDYMTSILNGTEGSTHAR